MVVVCNLVSLIYLNPFIMNNKSIKALALLAIFGVSLAGASVQFQPEETKETKETKIRRDLVAKFKPPKNG